MTRLKPEQEDGLEREDVCMYVCTPEWTVNFVRTGRQKRKEDAAERRRDRSRESRREQESEAGEDQRGKGRESEEGKLGETARGGSRLWMLP